MAITALDHIIYASPDLDLAVERITALTGVRPAPGGSHTGRGTRNALFSLGADRYVEILAPDPAQPPEAIGRSASRIPAQPRITTWAVKCDDLEEALRIATAHDLDLGHIEAMSRALPFGDVLSWRLTRGAEPAGGLCRSSSTGARPATRRRVLPAVVASAIFGLSTPTLSA